MIPLVTTALGVAGTLLGVLLGQGLANQRENLRWQREVGRETVRWERERQERQEQWAHEDAFRWHRERHEAYARLLAALERYADALHQHVVGLDVANEPLTTRERDALVDNHDVMVHALASVQLIGSSDVREAATAAANKYSYVDICVGMASRDVVQADASWRAAQESLRKLRNNMRLDLAVEADRIAPLCDLTPDK